MPEHFGHVTVFPPLHFGHVVAACSINRFCGKHTRSPPSGVSSIAELCKPFSPWLWMFGVLPLGSGRKARAQIYSAYCFAIYSASLLGSLLKRLFRSVLLKRLTHVCGAPFFHPHREPFVRYYRFLAHQLSQHHFPRIAAGKALQLLRRQRGRVDASSTSASPQPVRDPATFGAGFTRRDRARRLSIAGI